MDIDAIGKGKGKSKGKDSSKGKGKSGTGKSNSSATPPSSPCKWCGKMGHFNRDCWHNPNNPNREAAAKGAAAKAKAKSKGKGNDSNKGKGKCKPVGSLEDTSCPAEQTPSGSASAVNTLFTMTLPSYCSCNLIASCHRSPHRQQPQQKSSSSLHQPGIRDPHAQWHASSPRRGWSQARTPRGSWAMARSSSDPPHEAVAASTTSSAPRILAPSQGGIKKVLE